MIVTKLVSSIGIATLGLVALGATAPGIAAIFRALVPLILVVAVAAAVLRLVWFYTRRW